MKHPLIGAVIGLALASAGCETDVAPSLFADFPFEYESKPVGDPSRAPYEAGDPAQFQIWIKPPPTPEELRARNQNSGANAPDRRTEQPAQR